MIPVLAHFIALFALLQNSPGAYWYQNFSNAHPVYIKGEYIGEEWVCDPSAKQAEICFAGGNLGSGDLELFVSP